MKAVSAGGVIVTLTKYNKLLEMTLVYEHEIFRGRQNSHSFWVIVRSTFLCIIKFALNISNFFYLIYI